MQNAEQDLKCDITFLHAENSSNWTAVHVKLHNIITFKTKEGKQHINKQHSLWQTPNPLNYTQLKNSLHSQEQQSLRLFLNLKLKYVPVGI